MTAAAATIAHCMFAVLLLLYSYFVFRCLFFLIAQLTIDLRSCQEAERESKRERVREIKRFSYWETIVMHRFTYTENDKKSQTKAQLHRDG